MSSQKEHWKATAVMKNLRLYLARLPHGAAGCTEANLARKQERREERRSRIGRALWRTLPPDLPLPKGRVWRAVRFIARLNLMQWLRFPARSWRTGAAGRDDAPQACEKGRLACWGAAALSLAATFSLSASFSVFAAPFEVPTENVWVWPAGENHATAPDSADEGAGATGPKEGDDRRDEAEPEAAPAPNPDGSVIIPDPEGCPYHERELQLLV